MANRHLAWALLLVATGLVACEGGALEDAGPVADDGGRGPVDPPDAGPRPDDASARDAAPPASDASRPDAGPADAGVDAPPLFSDDFESGDLGHSENGVEWCCNSVSVSDERARSGRYSLRFPFGPDGPGEDSWAEQRVALGRPMTDIWVSYALYVPANYAHRDDSPSNNKFFALYHAPYSRSGFSMNFTLWSQGGGPSELATTYAYERVWGGHVAARADFMSGTDPGWKQITMHIAAESGPEGRDGVIQLWRDGESMIDIRDARSWGGEGTNFFDEAYILGWSNSGFTEHTVLFVDDVRISETPLTP
ncbi:MAG: hypothetical protein SangKO_047800 [Sandaracinaceae bacterium]